MKTLLKVLISALIIIAFYTICGTDPAHAAPPEPARYERAPNVVDYIAVLDELKEYEKEIRMLAQLIQAEARGVKSDTEKEAVCDVVFNRVDAGFANGTISGVIKQRHQFAWHRGLPAPEKFKAIARTALTKWLLEKRGIENVGRVLPNEYKYFVGHRGHNCFTKEYKDGKYFKWGRKKTYVD